MHSWNFMTFPVDSLNTTLHFSFIFNIIAMEALNTNTGNLLTTLVVITSISVSSPRAINPGNIIKNQVAYKYI